MIMQSKRIDLADYAEGFETKAYVDLYLCEDSYEYSHHIRPLVVICPGGGYTLTSDREAEPVARVFLARGYHAAVLRYTCRNEDGTAIAPKPLYEAALTVKLLRSRAEEYNIAPENIAINGYSAGGHLAASLSCLYNDEALLSPIGVTAEQCRPNASVLCYPVITADPACSHEGSFINLLGNERTEEQMKFWSLENRVGAHVPPTFIWHTADDSCVPIENSLRYALALSRSGVNFEYHVFPHGVHGLSTAGGETYPSPVYPVTRWMSMCTDWLSGFFRF